MVYGIYNWTFRCFAWVILKIKTFSVTDSALLDSVQLISDLCQLYLCLFDPPQSLFLIVESLFLLVPSSLKYTDLACKVFLFNTKHLFFLLFFMHSFFIPFFSKHSLVVCKQQDIAILFLSFVHFFLAIFDDNQAYTAYLQGTCWVKDLRNDQFWLPSCR